MPLRTFNDWYITERQEGEKPSKIILTKPVPNDLFERLCFGDFYCMQKF